MSQNENFENNRNMHIYNSNENNQNFNSLSNSITDMQKNFINIAVSQALTNPFVINNITNSVISNISNNPFFKIPSKTTINKLTVSSEASNSNIAPKEKKEKKIRKKKNQKVMKIILMI